MITVMAFWLMTMPTPMSTANALILVAVINGVFGLTAAGAAFWTTFLFRKTHASTRAIEHSVNSDREHMVKQAETMAREVTALKKIIGRMNVERARRHSIKRR